MESIKVNTLKNGRIRLDTFKKLFFGNQLMIRQDFVTSDDYAHDAVFGGKTKYQEVSEETASQFKQCYLTFKPSIVIENGNICLYGGFYSFTFMHISGADFLAVIP